MKVEGNQKAAISDYLTKMVSASRFKAFLAIVNFAVVLLIVQTVQMQVGYQLCLLAFSACWLFVHGKAYVVSKLHLTAFKKQAAEEDN